MTTTDEPALWDLPPEGRPRVECQMCEEPLTAAESRRWGLGRHCRRKLGLSGAPGVGRFEVEQDGLPGF